MQSSLHDLLLGDDFQAIPFELTLTNHLEIRASVNGVEGLFILDTGASNTCIGMDRIERFSLVTEVSEIKAAGAGATDMETAVASGNQLSIGAWEREDQQLVLFDLSHVNTALLAHDAQAVDGIIGSDVLREAHAVLDYGGKLLYLKRYSSKGESAQE